MEERSSTPSVPHTPSDGAASLQLLLRPELFKALGDSTRLQVLMRLITASTPQTVSDVADCCGVHLSGVSRHLAALKAAGVVTAQRRGREVLYCADCAAITQALRGLADAIDRCRASCCPPGGEGETPCPPNP
ncbi:MAG: metalloregulator ArsR/SmtB family transcription factor [Acidobacteriota bacterium]